jgi:hypothetical protein
LEVRPLAVDRPRGLSGTQPDAVDLNTLTPRQLDILCALWNLGPMDSRSLYLALPEGWTYPDLRNAVDGMRKARLVSRKGRGQKARYAVAVDRGQVLKTLAACPNTAPADLVRVAAIGADSPSGNTDTPPIAPR